MPSAHLNPCEISLLMQPVCADLGDEELVASFKAVEERLGNPRSYVTVCGETSTGKSTVINSLIGRKLLPTGSTPTNAAVVQISFDNGADSEFSFISRNKTIRSIEEDEFKDLVTAPTEELLRLRVRLDPPDPEYHGLEVFDTPGYNSVMVEHEEILRSFLPESDVIVLLTSYKTGFGQIDQDLLDVIRAATAGIPDLPILLVVNRIPEGKGIGDKRVKEILSNATDCLKLMPEVFLVRAVAPVDGGDEITARIPEVVPDTGELWSRVAAIVMDDSRISAVEVKLRLLLAELIEEADSVALNRVLSLTSEETARTEIEHQLSCLISARETSCDLVKTRVQSIERMLPMLLDRELATTERSLCNEIDNSDRWLGIDDCGEWIAGHAFEFECRRIGKSLESFLLSELDKLNDELEEIANTAVKRIQAFVRVKDSTRQDLGSKLAGDILQRVGGHVVRGYLSSIGGACGVSAGAGNLAKMILKRAGGLFGRTFSRQVYDNIGRTFTKKFVQGLNVAVYLVIETIGYLHQVSTWQAKFKKEIPKAITKWRDEVYKDLSGKQIQDILDANLKGVHDVYDSIIRDLEFSLNSGNPAEEIERMKGLRTKIDGFRRSLMP